MLVHSGLERAIRFIMMRPHWAMLLTCSNYLLALVIRPEPTERVRHLAKPCPRNTVEESTYASRAYGLAHGLDHPLVPRRLQPHLRQI